jgi:hypothetical protein
MKRKYSYTLNLTESRSCGDTYRHITAIIMAVRKGEVISSEDLLTINWQSSTGIDGWYGCNVLVKCNGHTDRKVKQLSEAASFLKKVGCSYHPETWIQSLERNGVTRVVYDGRLSSHVPIDNVAGVEFSAYGARTGGDHLCSLSCLYVSTLASDEASASQKLTQEFARLVSEHGGAYPSYITAFQKWMNEGKVPFKLSGEHPKFKTTDELLNSCFRPEQVSQAA